jgi:hypothetical protein
MKLKQFLKAVDSRICGGSEYLWDCFPDGQYIDISDIEGHELGGCIASRKTQEVYQIEIHIDEDNQVFRWTSPDWIAEYGMEADRRKVDKFIAYDDVAYTDVGSEDEMLDIARRVVHMTFVHSHTPIKDAEQEVLGLSPAAVWPFPKMDDTTEDYVEGMNLSEAGDEDYVEGMSGELDYTPPAEEEEFEVVLTVKHKLSVKAPSMEDAVQKAREFNKNFRNGGWPKGLVWEDQWVSKETATRRLETVNIKD